MEVTQSDGYDIFANKLITRLIDNLRAKHLNKGLFLSLHFSLLKFAYLY